VLPASATNMATISGGGDGSGTNHTATRSDDFDRSGQAIGGEFLGNFGARDHVAIGVWCGGAALVAKDPPLNLPIATRCGPVITASSWRFDGRRLRRNVNSSR